jgi:hypothetical protein
MSEKLFAQIIAELVESQGVALGLLTASIASQLDAQQLADELGRNISSAKNQAAFPGAAENLATHALEAALAVAKQQSQSRH